MQHITKKLATYLLQAFRGWEVGLEPTTSRSTIWRSNQLNYAHHLVGFRCRKSGAKVHTFCKLTKYFCIFYHKTLIYNTKYRSNRMPATRKTSIKEVVRQVLLMVGNKTTAEAVRP